MTRHKPLSTVWLGPQPAVVINCPKMARWIFFNTNTLTFCALGLLTCRVQMFLGSSLIRTSSVEGDCLNIIQGDFPKHFFLVFKTNTIRGTCLNIFGGNQLKFISFFHLSGFPKEALVRNLALIGRLPFQTYTRGHWAIHWARCRGNSHSSSNAQ